MRSDQSRSSISSSDSIISFQPKQPPLIPLSYTSNINFRPLPSTSGKCSKLKLKLILHSTLHKAGGSIKGTLEVRSHTKTDLLIGEIAVQLSGYEEISGKDYKQSKSFLSARIVFQGDRTPPSEAVRGPSRNGFYLANKGKSSFPFVFDLPSDAPASFQYQNIAKLKYAITGLVQYKLGGQVDTIFKVKDAEVVDVWDSALRNDAIITKGSNFKKTYWGGDGEVHLEAAMTGNIHTSGSSISIDVKVNNNSKTQVRGLKVSFVRRLMMLCPPEDSFSEEDNIKIFNEVVDSISYKEKDFVYDAKEERLNKLCVNIPKQMQTIRNNCLTEIACKLVVGLAMPGLLSKPLIVELPLKVCHSKSLEIAELLKNEVPVLPPLPPRLEPLSLSFLPSQSLGNKKPAAHPHERVLPWSDDEDATYHRNGNWKKHPAQFQTRRGSDFNNVCVPQIQPVIYCNAEERNRDIHEQSFMLDVAENEVEMIVPKLTLLDPGVPMVNEEVVPAEANESKAFDYLFEKACNFLDAISFSPNILEDNSEPPQPPKLQTSSIPPPLPSKPASAVNRDSTKISESGHLNSTEVKPPSQKQPLKTIYSTRLNLNTPNIAPPVAPTRLQVPKLSTKAGAVNNVGTGILQPKSTKSNRSDNQVGMEKIRASISTQVPYNHFSKREFHHKMPRPLPPDPPILQARKSLQPKPVLSNTYEETPIPPPRKRNPQVLSKDMKSLYLKPVNIQSNIDSIFDADEYKVLTVRKDRRKR
ncbi:hypothetical protein BC833DRAFT_580572 [Globomyces pollinis-pini]|nr:hypothetical protein BC833DRAFT_580572 [Globomyces pollinis-pini]